MRHKNVAGSKTSSHGFELSILVEISGHNYSGGLEEGPQLCLGLQPYDDPALPELDILSLALVQAQPEPVQYFSVTTFNCLKYSPTQDLGTNRRQV